MCILLTLLPKRTLAGMFPNLDKDVIDDVVRMQQGRYVWRIPGVELIADPTEQGRSGC